MSEKLKKLLDEKKEIYGDAVENITGWASMITNLLTRAGKLKEGSSISPEEGCLIMIAFKINREAHKHSEDNVIDIAGYQKILEDIHERKTKTERG